MGNRNDSYQLQLEDFLELATEILTNQSQSAVNPPTLSAVNSCQLTNNQNFTEQEIDQLQSIVRQPEIDLDQAKQELKQELKAELTAELKQDQPQDNNSKQTFRRELIDYSSNYELVKLTVQSGTAVKGILCTVNKDFIIVINQNNHFINIPISKIVMVKKINDLNKGDLDPEQRIETISRTEEVESPLPAPKELLEKETVKVRRAKN